MSRSLVKKRENASRMAQNAYNYKLKGMSRPAAWPSASTFPEHARSRGKLNTLNLNVFRPKSVHFLICGYLCVLQLRHKGDMAGRITSMSKIKQVLIMHSQGVSNRDIATEIGLNKCTVNEYMRKVRMDPLGIEELLKLEDPELEGRLFAGSPAYSDLRMEVFLNELPYYREQFKIPHVTRYLLWEEYIQKHPGGYSKSQFFFHLKQNLVVEKSVAGVLKNRSSQARNSSWTSPAIL